MELDEDVHVGLLFGDVRAPPSEHAEPPNVWHERIALTVISVADADGKVDFPSDARFTSSWAEPGPLTYATTPTWTGVATLIALVLETPDALYNVPSTSSTFFTFAVLTMSSTVIVTAFAIVLPAKVLLWTRNVTVATSRPSFAQHKAERIEDSSLMLAVVAVATRLKVPPAAIDDG